METKLRLLSCFMIMSLIFGGCKNDSMNDDALTPPKWVSGYPNIKSGASSIDVYLKSDKAQITFYILSSVEMQITSADSLRKMATTGDIDFDFIEKGAFPVGKEEKVLTFDSLPDNSTYYIYLIAEGNDLLQNDNEIVDEKVTLFVRHEERSYQSNPSIGDGYEHAYMLYKPEAYYKNVDEEFPLLIFLHGAGERGTLNYQKLRRNGPPKLIEKGVEMPFIVASPQIPETPDGWLANITDEFLSKLQDELRIDASRIYITGISLGGNGTFRYTAAYPEKVAAAVPISGWGSGNWCESARVPIWAFHNNDDMVVPAQDTRNAVININNCGLQPQAEMTIYESGGHDAWTKTYDGSAGHDIYSWMLSYTK